MRPALFLTLIALLLTGCKTRRVAERSAYADTLSYAAKRSARSTVTADSLSQRAAADRGLTIEFGDSGGALRLDSLGSLTAQGVRRVTLRDRRRASLTRQTIAAQRADTQRAAAARSVRAESHMEREAVPSAETFGRRLANIILAAALIAAAAVAGSLYERYRRR